MDCKDLMVGDWVSYKDDPPYIVRGTSICKVVTIDNGIDHRNVMDDAINPIPLTEEILVKNGFHKVPPHQLGQHTTYDLFKFKTNFMLTRKDEGNIIYDRNITVTYVHQLQHLLRLCGIEKEITLID